MCVDGSHDGVRQTAFFQRCHVLFRQLHIQRTGGMYTVSDALISPLPDLFADLLRGQAIYR